MPPAFQNPQPRCSAAVHPVITLLVLFALLALPNLARAWGSTMDPVYVFYPRASCDGEQIALEVWNRDEQRWAEHPHHPVIPVDSCQLEDAGVLLNEIRWRCLERDRSDRDESWSVGVRVFESEIMQRCDVARSGGGFGETEIHVSTPKSGETIADADGNLEIEGSVWIGGMAGAEYDVVIAIDTSNAESGSDDAIPLAGASDRPATPQAALGDPLVAQVRAARSFVDSIRDRLGEVRVGIVSFPGPRASAEAVSSAAGDSAARGESAESYAQREIPLTADAAAIETALKRIVDRGRAGPMHFSDGLALALDELFRPPNWPGAARPGARRIVLISSDGRGGFPFGPDAQADRDFRERNVELARSATLRGVALHLFALGGISEQPPAFIGEMIADSAGSFTRVPSPDQGTFFTERVSMPYLTEISVHDAVGDQEIGNLSFSPDGRFAASVPLSPGENHLSVKARTSDGDERESQLVVEFDASAYQERLLALEAARIRRARTKHLVLEVED